MSTLKTFLLPDLGEGLTDAELVSWTVAVGDRVDLNQVIAEVETAKASVEIPSPFAGEVAVLHAEAGDTIDVGAPFIEINTADDRDGDDGKPPAAPVQPPSEADAERVPVLVGYGVAEDTRSRRRPSTPQTPGVSEAPGTGVRPTPLPGRPLASPAVRYAATQRGIDLATVTATGEAGQVTRADLEKHLQGLNPSAETTAPTPARASSPQPLDEERIPIKGVRKHTAAAMVASAFTAPHVTEFVEVDVTPTMDLLAQLKAGKHFVDTRLTPLALIAKAVVVALRTNPTLNSTWDEQAQEIVRKRYVNLGIAAATPRGLMVPNIKNADRLGLRDLAAALSELTTTAREGKTRPADLSGGTITITNIGVFGIDSGTPILNPGEAAIIAFGAIRRKPWEYRGEVALRSTTTISLSFDHRLVDGEQGSQFLATVADALSDPVNLIALS